MSDELDVVTISEHSDLLDEVDALTSTAWPGFMLHTDIGNEHWHKLYQVFPEFQFALMAREPDRVVAVGNSVPLDWGGKAHELPEDGWDWALEKAVRGSSAGVVPNILCAISIAVSASYRGKGLSHRMVEAMRDIGEDHGFASLIAPVRPSMKSRYPLTAMERYVDWRTQNGLPFDPWMRVHARLGAEVLKVCPRSMRITGSVADWERWTEMHFPEDGEYVVPGALVPLRIDHELDQGIYIEPNVWMLHEIH